MAQILILAALPEEADAIFPGTGTRDSRPIPIRRLAVHNHNLTIATCGLGKVNAALAAGLLGASADLILMTGTCGALGAAPGAYWLAEAVQHDYGATHPGHFRRYRAGDWPMGDPGEAHFTAMPDPGLGLPHLRRLNPRFHYTNSLTVELADGSKTELHIPRSGNGYPHEAAEVVRCLRAGLLESPVMPLDESIALMGILDTMRAQIGVRYSADA
eukprot:gene40401-49965_t